MPHSSGGGSSSSSSSHGGSSSSGGSFSSDNSNRTSRHYFDGARCYRYRNRRGDYEYIYSDYDMVNRKSSKARYLILLFYIPFIFAIFMMGKDVFHFPTPLRQVYNTDILIEDSSDVLTNAEERDLEQAFMEFYQNTGITVSFVSVNQLEWMDRFNSLSDYAYYQYVNKFDDECHWLFVYSKGTILGQWSWEGMQGNNTDSILTQKITNGFNEKLQMKLYQDTKYTVGTAFISAIQELNTTVMNKTINTSQLIPVLIMSVFIAVHMFFMVFWGNRTYKDIEEVSRYSEQEKDYDINKYIYK